MASYFHLKVNWLVAYALVAFMVLPNIYVALPLDNRHQDHISLSIRSATTFQPESTSAATLTHRQQSALQPLLSSRGVVQMTKNLIHNTACMGSCTAKQIHQQSEPPTPIRHPNPRRYGIYNSESMAPSRPSRLRTGRIQFAPGDVQKPKQPASLPAPGPLRIGSTTTINKATSKAIMSSIAHNTLGQSGSKSEAKDRGKGKMVAPSPASSSSGSSPEHAVPTTSAGPSGTKSHVG
ncbi:unnamed protein product [Sympodiomycopsis kandeliae]